MSVAVSELLNIQVRGPLFAMGRYSGFQLRSNIAYRVEFYGKWHRV